MKRFRYFFVCLTLMAMVGVSPVCSAASGFLDSLFEIATGPYYAEGEEELERLDKARFDAAMQAEGMEHNAKVDGQVTEADKGIKGIDLVVILDKSGSMYGLASDTIGGFNSLLEQQRKKDVPVKVSVVAFNQASDVKYNRVPITEVKDLTVKDYMPQGTTALLDAVGNSLSSLKEMEGVNAEGNKVLVVIITDGMENASREWSKENVKKLISELQDEFRYEFVFMGADIDAVDVAGGLGISKEKSIKFRKTSGRSGGVQSNFRAINVMLDDVADGKSLDKDSKWRNSVVEDN